MSKNSIYFAKSISNGLFKDLEFFSIIFIEGMCVVALAPMIITIRALHSILY